MFHVVLNGFDHDDGIIDHEADGQNQAKQRQGVDRESESREKDEGPDQ